MTMLVQEHDKNRAIWAVPEYDKYSPGAENADRFMSVLRPHLGATVLDAGCGAGRGGLALEARGMQVHYLDITDAGIALGHGVDRRRFIQQPLWDRIVRPHALLWDYGYCCDVMEHIPPEFTMLVAHNLLDVCRTVWFQIAFFPDGFGAAIGAPLHLTVQPYSWWLERLAVVGDVVDARDLCGTGLFVVERR